MPTASSDRRAPEFSEDEILTACALRFDGYAFAERLGGGLAEMVEWARQEAPLPSVEHKLAALFGLQRWLCKWGGELISRTDPHWAKFRSLFLELVEAPIPDDLHGPSWDEWNERYVPHLSEAIECVRREHFATHYEAAETA